MHPIPPTTDPSPLTPDPRPLTPAPAPPDLKSIGLSTGRLEALSDGVLAIVITLLVLGFTDADERIAGSPGMSHGEVVSRLVELWPHFLGYVLSFLLIAVYWIQHHLLFHFIRRANWGLLWLNLLFLMSVAFLPFPTDLLAECISHESNAIVLLYGTSNVVVGLSLAGIWGYATRGRRFVAAELQTATIRGMFVMLLTAPVMNLLGMIASGASIPLGIGVFACVPLVYLYFARLDLLGLSRSQGREPQRHATPSSPFAAWRHRTAPTDF